MLLKGLTVFLFSSGVIAAPPRSLSSAQSLIEVHIVPHSHCDPGWWYTFEDYHNRWVIGILDAVIHTLTTHEHRTFIWAEVSYFKKWYDSKNDDIKREVKKVVLEGRLEFVTGGWVMHDEAVSHYRDDLLQLQLGQAWLWTELRVKPRVSWLIDPFGHSPTTPIFYRGMQGAVLNRIHYEVREERKARNDLEFIWRPKWYGPPAESAIDDINEQSYDDEGIFVHTLTKGYYDIPNTCGPDRNICETFEFEDIQHAIRITDSNLEERASVLAEQYVKKAASFKTKHVLIPLGDDFKYKTKEFTEDFLGQWDLLFNHINSNPKKFRLRIRYSNLSAYFDAVKTAEKIQPWSVYEGNFLQYSDKEKEYWSGFYTSRAVLKRWIRESQISLRFAELVDVWMAESMNISTPAIGSVEQRWKDLVLECQENQSLLQHHDAVTGTARRAVVDDYQERISGCVERINNIGRVALENVLGLPAKSISMVESAPSRFSNLMEDHETLFQLLPGRRYAHTRIQVGKSSLLLFNTLSFPREEFIQISVMSNNIRLIEGKNGSPVPFQLVESISYSDGQPENGGFILSFYAKLSAPLGYVQYLLETLPEEFDKPAHIVSPKIIRDSKDMALILTNGFIKLNFGESAKLLQSLEISRPCADSSCKVHRFDMRQSFAAYDSSKSGAYIFNPADPEATAFTPRLDFIAKTDGPLFSEIIFKYKFGDGVKGQVYRVYHDKNHNYYYDHNILMDIAGSSYNHNDLVVRYDVGESFDQGNGAWTDANGWMPIRNPIETNKERASQFRPMVSKFVVADGKKRKLEWLTKSSLAVANYRSGLWEFVLDRRVGHDDGRGLGEPLDDNKPFSKEFRLIPTITEDNSAVKMASTNDNRRLHLNRMSEMFLFPATIVVLPGIDFLVTAPLRFRLIDQIASLPPGLVIHSIRRCLSGTDDICIQLEHDGSVDGAVTIELADKQRSDEAGSFCKLYPSFYSTDRNDIFIEGCGSLTLRPYEIRVLRVSPIVGADNPIARRHDQSTAKIEFEKSVADAETHQLWLSFFLLLIAMARVILKGGKRLFQLVQDWTVTPGMRAKQF